MDSKKQLRRETSILVAALMMMIIIATLMFLVGTIIGMNKSNHQLEDFQKRTFQDAVEEWTVLRSSPNENVEILGINPVDTIYADNEGTIKEIVLEYQVSSNGKEGTIYLFYDVNTKSISHMKINYKKEPLYHVKDTSIF